MSAESTMTPQQKILAAKLAKESLEQHSKNILFNTAKTHIIHNGDDLCQLKKCWKVRHMRYGYPEMKNFQLLPQLKVQLQVLLFRV